MFARICFTIRECLDQNVLGLPWQKPQVLIPIVKLICNMRRSNLIKIEAIQKVPAVPVTTSGLEFVTEGLETACPPLGLGTSGGGQKGRAFCTTRPSSSVRAQPRKEDMFCSWTAWPHGAESSPVLAALVTYPEQLGGMPSLVPPLQIPP